MTPKYEPLGARGEFVLADDEQRAAFDDATAARYQRLADAWDANVQADRDLAACEKELHATVAASREIEAKLSALPRLSQWDLVMQARQTNR